MALVYFAGDDADGNRELWRTDGTTAGTVEVTPGAGFTDGFADLGLYPQSIAIDGSQVLFAGRDPTTNTNALWRYSAATGAVELTVAGATTDQNGAGFAPSGLVTYDGKVFFGGYDAAGTNALWESDGATAGTFQLAGPAQSSRPTYLTVLGGKLYFNGITGTGVDQAQQLWVLSDPAGSPTPINHPVPGISPVGYNISPKGIVALGSQLIFEGADIYGLYITRGELYAYNPTSGQILRLTSPSAGPQDSSDTFRDEDASFVVLGNVALFRTADSVLSVTDGTVAGTHAITGIVGANGGYFGPLGAVVGDVLLFREIDMANIAGLWASDGTGPGTHEITVLGAAAAGVQPTNITAIDAKTAVFTGVDAAGRTGLWVTDGTTAGTHEITGIAEAATAGINPDGFAAVPPPAAMPPSDFNGDGTSDILWQNTGGAVYDWGMVGAQHTTNITVAGPGSLPASQWTLIGTGDFNGDKTDDLLWQNNAGATYEWGLANGVRSSNISLGTLPGSQYQLIATGDFNGDGTDDLLWQDQRNGAVYDWGMVNGQHTTNITVAGAGALPLTAWTMIGKGDFNRDGTTDLLWQSKQSGAVYEWTMTGGQHTGDVSLGTLALSQYALIGTGDFNGDGTTDLLWQDKGSGSVYEWGMVGGQHATNISLGTLPTSQWSLLTTGDFDGNGTSDLLWQSKATGALFVWGMTNGQHTSDSSLGALSTSDWHTLSNLKT